MRSRTKKLVSMLCVAAMLVSALPVAAFAADGEAHDEAAHANVYEVAPDAQLKGEAAILRAAMPEARAASGFLKAAGDQESAYATWPIGAGVTKYEAYVAPEGGTYTKLDKELVREYPGYMRVDALGLKAGKYTIKVVDNTGKEMVTDTLTVLAHERTGFAFVNGSSSGAYNADGTLKSNAVVVYVDNSNFDSVQVTIGSTSYTGVQKIVNESGASKGAPGTPVCIRVLGTIDTTGFPKGSWDSSAEGLQVKGGSAKAKNLTIEGVGNDAAFNGFGMLIRNCENVEVRNLGFINFADDGVSIDTGNKYLWIHNCDFFYGGPGSDSDQAKGDGSLDVKASHYCSFSYNHFWDSGKCSLLGMHNDQNYITYHHNWFDHSDSRHPRIRIAKSVHVYNNYYDGVSKYGIGAAEKSGAFVEANYFRNTKYPMLSSLQGSDIAGGGKGTFSGEPGGIIKAYNNKIIGAQSFIPYDAKNAPVEFDAYVAKTRDEKVPSSVAAKSGGTTYTNFDTTDNIGVTAAQVESPDDAMLTTTKWAGRVDGGDIQWQFNNAVDDESYSVNAALKKVLTSYKTTLVSVGGTVKNTVSGGSPATHTHTPGAWKVTVAPGCDPDTQALVDGEEAQSCTICGEVLNTRTLAGAHSNDGQGVCSVCGKGVSNGGGAVISSNSKILNAVDFTMHETTGEKSNTAAMRAEDMAAVADGYFTMSGSGVNKRTKNATTVGSKAEWIDLPKTGNGGIQFTLSNVPADVTVSWGNTGANQTSTLLIKNGEGAQITEEDHTDSKSSSKTSTTVTLTEKGTYIVASKQDAGYSVRLYTLTVTEAEKAHEWSEWVVVTPATCGRDGLEKRTCSDCDKTETRDIEATGDHTWGGWVVDDDEEVRTCSVCGETETKSGEQPTPPEPVVVDKSGLTSIISKANAAVDAVVEDTSAANVPVNTSWALKADIDAFKAAIAQAQTVVDNADATAGEVSAAVTALNAAMATFVDKIQDGAKGAGGGTTTGAKTFESKNLTAFSSGKTNGATETAGTDNYFTIIYSTSSKVDNSSKTWEDGYESNQRLNLGGKLDTGKNAIKFTTAGAATVKVWFVQGGDDNRQMAIITGDKADVSVSSLTGMAKNSAYYAELSISAAGTYFLGGKENNNYIFKVEVVETTSGDDTPVAPAVDKTALNAAITAAEADMNAATVSTDGSDVATTDKWVSQADKDVFAAEITAAKLAAKTAKTADDVTAAVNALKTASDAFEAAKRSGTKTGGGSSGDSGSGSSGGGGGGGSPTPTKKPAVEVTPGDDTFLTIDSATKDNVAVAELTDKQMSALTSNAVKNNSANIVVTVNALNSAGTTRVNVSANALDNMADKTDAALTLQTPMGDVKLPAASVADLGGNSGKTISVLIAKTDDGVKLTVAAGNKILDKVAGGVTAITEAGGSGSVAYLVAADGSEKLVKKSYVEAGKLHANLPGSGTIVLKDNAKTFRDTEDNWAKDAIGFAASRELFNGVNELDFAPNQEMTRAMLVTVLYRLEGAVNKAGNSFKDVPADSWYADAVAWANAEGIVSGKLEGYFGPDDDITREQLATILYRYATKLCGMEEVSESSKALEKYPDAAVVSGFAVDGMKWCVREGIIGGRGDGTLAPSGFASRAEVATMLMRFVKAIV